MNTFSFTRTFCTYLLICLGVGISSCEEEHALEPKGSDSKMEHEQPLLKSSTQSYTVHVDARGFLVFPTEIDLQAYASFILSSTLGEVQSYHQSLGFSSLAGDKYDDLDPGTPITDELLKDFTLDVHGTVQAKGTLFKVSGNEQSLLTIQTDIVNDSNFDRLVSENFDINQMNRFSINLDRGDGMDLFGTISENPYGIDEGSLVPLMAGPTRKFIGVSRWWGPCNDGWRVGYATGYFFWIKMGTEAVDLRPC